MTNFIFEDINDKGRATKGEFQYYIDNETGEILFKTKYDFEEFDYYSLKFVIGNNVYLTDKCGNTLLIANKEKFNSVVGECNSKNVENDISTEDNLFDKFQDKNYSEIYKVYYDKANYYIVKQNDLYAIIDENGHEVIDFKYAWLWDLYISKNEKPLFIAKNSKTNKQGIIDIDDKIVIPFIYDEIHNWSIDTTAKTMIAEKDGLYGVINIENNILIDFKYKYIFGYWDFENFTLAKNTENLWGLIDKKGMPIEFDLSKVKEINATNLRKKHKTNIIISNQVQELKEKLNPYKQRTPKPKKKPDTDKNQLKINLKV